MRILAVLPQYVPWSRVGAWVTTHEYLTALATRHDVDVVCLYTKQPAYEIDGVRVWPNGTDLPAPDLVVSHLGDTGYGAHVAETLGVPSVRFVHGYHDQNRERLGQHPTALAIYSSQALADDTGWDGPTLVAHPPVWSERYTVTPGECVTLSNLSVAKGGELLPYLAAALFDTQFLGVRGWGRQQSRQPSNVQIIDPVEDMRDVYAQTRILLMPSDRESYGRVAVEAACSGIPTVAHPSPGLVEAMGDHATWVDRADLGGWIEVLRVLEDHDAWYEASVRARLATPKDPQATIDKVCDAVESLVKVAA